MTNINDLRVTKTLENIKNGFSICIKQKTFTSITVKDIITAAKINRSTFYKYYEDKYQLRESLISSTLDELSNNINLDAFKLDINSINILSKQLEFMYSQKDWYLTLWNKNIELYVYDDMIHVFEKKTRECAAEYSKISYYEETNLSKNELFARLFSSSAMTTIKWWYECSPNTSPKDVSKIIIDNIKSGMHHAFCSHAKSIGK
ncbi:TetR family transcriptional regulator [Clostridium felsineum]|uniref:TetR family transcriptional regulator n=1 Tax=Clostridium felsineum TaxID=36839 RepID=UPI00098C578F|nr:TetR family transcriptional regulator [Clostridium felsineum]URZ04607.1 hypothetical protein CLAUR_046960 [Clostridium felsineum]